MFQFYNLIPNLTALENVELAAQIIKDPMPAAEVLTQVGLGERMDNFPAQLSGGEQQRVAIARAMSMDSRLLLADEPTGNLDTENGSRIIDLLTDLAHKDGYCVIIATHDTEILPRMDQVCRIQDGKLIPL